MTKSKSANVNVRIQENIKIQAENILEAIGISRATAIEMYYRQIILNRGIPFSLKLPIEIPIRENMTENDFNLMMTNGYLEALNNELYDLENVFEELENN